MKQHIGYLVPEFPGQTHAFLWRERTALDDLGVQADLVSTRRPPEAIASHSWSQSALQMTFYLLPFTAADLGWSLWDLLRMGPDRWGAIISVLCKAEAPTPTDRLRFAAMLLPAAKLARYARKAGWSHLHVHSCADAANIAMLSFLMSGLPYSLTLHGPTLELYGRNQRLKWHHSRFVTVISKRLCQHVVSTLALAPPDCVFVAAMGVDLDRSRRSLRYRPWEPAEPCRLFSCGRLNPIKGHDDLLRVLALLRQNGIDATLRIAGEDEQGGTGYRRLLEAEISRAGLQDRVALLGAISEEDIRKELEAAQVFVLASHNEGISVAIMEAMAMEIPVVVTDVGGNGELVDDEVDGLLVQDRDTKGMAAAIQRVLGDRDLRERLRTASRQKIVRQFSHRISAATIAAALDGIPSREEWVPVTPKSVAESPEGVSAFGART